MMLSTSSKRDEFLGNVSFHPLCEVGLLQHFLAVQLVQSIPFEVHVEQMSLQLVALLSVLMKKELVFGAYGEPELQIVVVDLVTALVELELRC